VDGFTTNESARIIGYMPDMLRGLKSHGLQPAGPNGLWSTAQVLGLCCRCHAHRAGAAKLAADAAFRLMCFADLPKLRQAREEGKRFLRLFGERCDTSLVTRKSAFDSKVMAAATEARLPYVVVNIEFWLQKLKLQKNI